MLEARRRFIVAGFIAAVVAIGFCLYGLYAPIFELAENIKAE